MKFLEHLFKKPDDEEVRLVKEVQEERVKFDSRRRRADRILQDFHRADDVVRGRTGGQHGA